ncbi:unnamed protein product [Prorocentrum cordatum]|uniref:Uncharacterized protein n=1 Tax=Prorocentrum cordatum TaxID=2364126 RepID=A0ABN9RV76_9DINO|nr:unnamed protein product [Polarella glacialis]
MAAQGASGASVPGPGGAAAEAPAAAKADGAPVAESFHIGDDDDDDDGEAPEIAPGAGGEDGCEAVAGAPTGRGLGALWAGASLFGRKATQLGSKARQKLAEEALAMAEEARDFAHGVREGAQITAQEARALADRKAREQRERGAPGWLGARGTASCPESSGEAPATAGLPASTAVGSAAEAAEPGAARSPAVPAEAGEAAAPEDCAASRAGPLQVLRQGLAATREASGTAWLEARQGGGAAASRGREPPAWLLPSTRSNYVQLSPGGARGDGRDGARAAARRVRRLGGKLAKTSREVSEILRQAGAAAGAALGPLGAAGAGPLGEAGAGGEADPIFEIGSDDDGGIWSGESPTEDDDFWVSGPAVPSPAGGAPVLAEF